METDFDEFLSTPSARRATRNFKIALTDEHKFLSTPSARRATYRLVRLAKFDEFLSTPSARRATENDTGPWTQTQISIHALREEGD